MDILNKCWVFVFLPFTLSIAALFTGSVWLYALIPVSHFLILIFVPLFWGRENLWMFISVTISTIPINVLMMIKAWEYAIFDVFGLTVGILIVCLCYVSVFSVEQLIMGVITRVIWKRQIKSPLADY